VGKAPSPLGREKEKGSQRGKKKLTFSLEKEEIVSSGEKKKISEGASPRGKDGRSFFSTKVKGRRGEKKPLSSIVGKKGEEAFIRREMPEEFPLPSRRKRGR